MLGASSAAAPSPLWASYGLVSLPDIKVLKAKAQVSNLARYKYNRYVSWTFKK